MMRKDVCELTERESEVLRLLAAGYRYKRIAAELAISPRTVDTHVTNIKMKLFAATISEAVITASHRNLLNEMPKMCN